VCWRASWATTRDAEDLTQEAFVRALGALDVFRGDGTFGAWLLRIAVHVGRDHVRRKGRAPERMALEELAGAALDVIDVKAGATPDAAPTERELADRLAWAIDRLPVGLRAALVLRVLEGRGYDEVAAVLGVRPATARTQVMKARRALEELLGPWLDAPGRGQS
jgi:RNA polymerase sigma-70 factor (ECF subfamily)